MVDNCPGHSSEVRRIEIALTEAKAQIAELEGLHESAEAELEARYADITAAAEHLRQAACQEYCPIESGMRTSPRGYSEEQEHVTRALEILTGEGKGGRQ